MSHKKATAASPKNIGVPKTVQEKYDKLKVKNPALEKLVEVFGLELGL